MYEYNWKNCIMYVYKLYIYIICTLVVWCSILFKLLYIQICSMYTRLKKKKIKKYRSENVTRVN